MNKELVLKRLKDNRKSILWIVSGSSHIQYSGESGSESFQLKPSEALEVVNGVLTGGLNGATPAAVLPTNFTLSCHFQTCIPGFLIILLITQLLSHKFGNFFCIN